MEDNRQFSHQQFSISCPKKKKENKLGDFVKPHCSFLHYSIQLKRNCQILNAMGKNPISTNFELIPILSTVPFSPFRPPTLTISNLFLSLFLVSTQSSIQQIIESIVLLGLDFSLDRSRLVGLVLLCLRLGGLLGCNFGCECGFVIFVLLQWGSVLIERENSTKLVQSRCHIVPTHCHKNQKATPMTYTLISLGLLG